MILVMLACSQSELDFTISPNPVAFGEVDFAVEMPDEGYSPIATSLTNNGTVDVLLSLNEWDDDHLCVQGYDSDNLPGAMGVVAPGSTYILNIAVCAVGPGESDTEVPSFVTVGTDGNPASFTIDVTFTPVRSGEDTG